MTTLMSGRRASALFSLCLLAILAQVRPTFAEKCTDDPEAYETAQYTVRRVRIDTPLAWLLASVGNVTDQILTDKEMPIKANDDFRKQAFDDGFVFVNNKFPPLQVRPGTRFASRAAYPDIENCNATTKHLDIVYRVYSLSFSNYLTRTFEFRRKEEASRGVPETTATKRLSQFMVRPYAGYNRSRGVFGGTSFSAQVPTQFIKNVTLNSSGSSSSSEISFNASGSRERERGPVRYTEWDFEYFRTDVPSGAVDLKRATGRAQIIAATRSLGSKELIVRFGGSVEGGNRQTDLAAVELPSDAIASSGHKAVKAFVGGSLNWGRHAFKTSYGAQFGNAGDDFKLDYVKQVLDAGADLRFLPWESHHPVTIQGRFAAGTINTRGRLPVAERFIGGNTEQNFLSGSTWVIQENPLIRSFPQNRFARAQGEGVFGGERFFSANLTLTATVWGRPLVPKEVMDYCAKPNLETEEAVADDDDICLTLDEAVALGLSVAESGIKSAYVSDTPEFKAMSEQVKKLKDPLVELVNELTLVQKLTDPAVQAALQKLYQPPPTPDLQPSGTFAAVAKSVTKILSDMKEDKVNRADVRTLTVGLQSKPNSSRIEKMAADLGSLAALLPSVQAGRIETLRQTFLTTGEMIKVEFNKLVNSDIDKEAERKAKRDMVYPTRVINELTHEANLYSVSPVAFLDAARLWQSKNRPDSLRYGVGAGGRFTLVSLDVTAGYAWNIHPRPGEGRGAFVFSMELSNLFR